MSAAARSSRSAIPEKVIDFGYRAVHEMTLKAKAIVSAHYNFRKGPYYADVGDFSSAGTAEFHLVKTLPEGLPKSG